MALSQRVVAASVKALVAEITLHLSCNTSKVTVCARAVDATVPFPAAGGEVGWVHQGLCQLDAAVCLRAAYDSKCG